MTRLEHTPIALRGEFLVLDPQPRIEGREAIRGALAPVWDRALRTNRRISGHEHVAFHETTDPEVAIVEFDLVGDTARGPFRQAMVYLLRIRDGRVLLLREFVDTAALSELFQVGAPTD